MGMYVVDIMFHNFRTIKFVIAFLDKLRYNEIYYKKRR
ncbi:hypothetical protein IMSAGC013_03849 [Lachnospiraceae bacterium]|nr:hypothetical protein IMSAGC013_03849 [Lachnospiraceae bacterium]